jgi:adenosine deaminase CECR1
MKLDTEGEGRHEFFEVIGARLNELARNPDIATDLLVENMKRFGAEGLRYLETQASLNFRDRDGNPIDPEKTAQIWREALSRPEAKATGVTVRFQTSMLRFSPQAEQTLENSYKFVDRNRDLWVGINMAGREDNDKGFALRFLDTFRKMRRIYSGIGLSIHGGEVDSPGPNVRDTLLLGATRIGHGLNLITDPDTMLLMRNNRYLVEINLISNRLLEYVPDLSKHPFPEYLRFGIPVCLNTDDPGVWDSNMTDEYYTAVTHFNLSWDEIVELGRNSLTYSFAEPAAKRRLLEEYQAAVSAFEKKYGDDKWVQTLQKVKPLSSGYAARTFGISQQLDR